MAMKRMKKSSVQGLSVRNNRTHQYNLWTENVMWTFVSATGLPS